MLHFGQTLAVTISFLRENNPIISQNTLHIKQFAPVKIKINLSTNNQIPNSIIIDYGLIMFRRI